VDNLSGSLGGKNDPRQWYTHPINNRFGPGIEDRDNRASAAWMTFVDAVTTKQQLLFYAQREWVVKWFPDYDPTNPDGLEDTNNPWDLDHIHPRRYMNALRSIPQVLKDWHTAIGNLRVWPLEANRADQVNSPKQKLEYVSTEARYGMSTCAAVREASFVADDCRDLWIHCVPEDGPLQYLSNSGQGGYHDYRIDLLKALVFRTHALYQHWYKELLIAQLLS
jgi:hypothetical protein